MSEFRKKFYRKSHNGPKTSKDVTDMIFMYYRVSQSGGKGRKSVKVKQRVAEGSQGARGCWGGG